MQLGLITPRESRRFPRHPLAEGREAPSCGQPPASPLRGRFPGDLSTGNTPLASLAFFPCRHCLVRGSGQGSPAPWDQPGLRRGFCMEAMHPDLCREAPGLGPASSSAWPWAPRGAGIRSCSPPGPTDARAGRCLQGACAWWLLPKGLPVLGSTPGPRWGPPAHPGPVTVHGSLTLWAQLAAQGGGWVTGRAMNSARGKKRPYWYSGQRRLRSSLVPGCLINISGGSPQGATRAAAPMGAAQDPIARPL